MKRENNFRRWKEEKRAKELFIDHAQCTTHAVHTSPRCALLTPCVAPCVAQDPSWTMAKEVQQNQERQRMRADPNYVPEPPKERARPTHTVHCPTPCTSPRRTAESVRPACGYRSV